MRPSSAEHGEGSTDDVNNSNAGASSSATDGSASFSPSGLKVLVVDDDPMCLKVVSAMLQRCSYEVDTRCSGHEALQLLRERQEQNHQFDLVLSDVYMPDMDGFKLLEHIGLELDLPVIMMSSNGDTDIVLRGVTHGAVDFLIKPVRVEELRNIWQHVVRRRSIHVPRAADEHSGFENDTLPSSHGMKRKESEALQVQHETQGANKKPRVVWSVEMHQQFVDAVNQLGVDKAVPKRILDLMNVEGLTRENVASHLQKYRLYLKRAQGLQNGRGSKGHKAAQEAALLDPQAAAAAAAVAAGAGPQSVFAQVAAQQAAMAAGAPHLNGQPAGAMPHMGGGMPGMPPPGMPVMAMPGAAAASMAAAAAWQQQTLAMHAAAAAAASGALPAGMPPGAMFPMPPGAMMPPHMAAAMAAGMPMPMMGPPPGMAGMDGSPFGPMVFPQQQPAVTQPGSAQQAQQACSNSPGTEGTNMQRQGSATPPSLTWQQAAASPVVKQEAAASPVVKQEAGAGAPPGFPSTSVALPTSNASALTAESGLMSNGHHRTGSDGSRADVPPDLPMTSAHDALCDDALMSGFNADSLLADVPLPRLEMDDFLDSFLTGDRPLEESGL